MSEKGHSLEERYRSGWTDRQVVLFGGAVVLGLGALVVWVIGVGLALLFGGWLAWTALFHADPAVSSELLTWDQVDDHETTAVVRVTYGDGWVDADCSVRAIAEDKTIVGEVSFTPAEGEGPDHEVSINTERRPTAVDLVGCTTEGQPRPR